MSQAAIVDVGCYVDEAEDVLFNYGNLYKSRPHDFWKKCKVLLPSPVEVVQHFLSVQLTSCEFERAFSRAGYLTSDRRTHLGTNRLCDLLFHAASHYRRRKKTDKVAAHRPGIP